jgi:hypothetical protein
MREKVKVKKINSIMFQIAVTNMLLLIAFFVVMVFVMFINENSYVNKYRNVPDDDEADYP